MAHATNKRVDHFSPFLLSTLSLHVSGEFSQQKWCSGDLEARRPKPSCQNHRVGLVLFNLQVLMLPNSRLEEQEVYACTVWGIKDVWPLSCRSALNVVLRFWRSSFCCTHVRKVGGKATHVEKIIVYGRTMLFFLFLSRLPLFPVALQEDQVEVLR